MGCEGCEDYKEEPIDAYATKYKECRVCGTEADCTYISQIDGLCNSCRANEEYYEHDGSGNVWEFRDKGLVNVQCNYCWGSGKHNS